MSVEDIIKKHDYNEELANFLRKTYPELVRFFNNEEKLVYEALMSTPIKLTDNVYNCLIENGFLKNRADNEMVPIETLKFCAGVYQSEPVIEYDKNQNKYSITGINRIVSINAYNMKLDSAKGTLIHELCHLIKSYYNEFTINQDTLVERSGLITKIYQLNNDNGEVKKSILSETGVGLEEGFNAVAEETVTSNVIGQPFKTKGYQMMRDLAKNLVGYDIPDLYEIIKEAQIYHDNTRLDSTIGETYYKAMEFADKVYPMLIEVLNPNNKFPIVKKISDEIDELIKTEYRPIQEELYKIGQSSKTL